jgi:hypothetical protein
MIDNAISVQWALYQPATPAASTHESRAMMGKQRGTFPLGDSSLKLLISLLISQKTQRRAIAFLSGKWIIRLY